MAAAAAAGILLAVVVIPLQVVAVGIILQVVVVVAVAGTILQVVVQPLVRVVVVQALILVVQDLVLVLIPLPRILGTQKIVTVAAILQMLQTIPLMAKITIPVPTVEPIAGAISATIPLAQMVIIITITSTVTTLITTTSMVATAVVATVVTGVVVTAVMVTVAMGVVVLVTVVLVMAVLDMVVGVGAWAVWASAWGLACLWVAAVGVILHLTIPFIPAKFPTTPQVHFQITTRLIRAPRMTILITIPQTVPKLRILNPWLKILQLFPRLFLKRVFFPLPLPWIMI